MTIERPYGQPSCGQVAVFGGRDQSWHLAAKADSSLDTKPAPELVDWKMSPTPEASPAFDDSAWKHSETPQQMGADGDISAFAWYRASVNVPSPTNGTLHFQGADNLEVFVNGRHIASQKGNAKADFVAVNRFHRKLLFRVVDGIKIGIIWARWTTMTTKDFGDRPRWKWAVTKVKSQAGQCAAESKLTLLQLKNGANHRAQKVHRRFIKPPSKPLLRANSAHIQFCASIIRDFHAGQCGSTATILDAILKSLKLIRCIFQNAG